MLRAYNMRRQELREAHRKGGKCMFQKSETHGGPAWFVSRGWDGKEIKTQIVKMG